MSGSAACHPPLGPAVLSAAASLGALCCRGMTRLEQLALRDMLLDLEPLRLPTSLTALLVDRRVAVHLHSSSASQPAAKRVHKASHSCLLAAVGLGPLTACLTGLSAPPCALLQGGGGLRGADRVGRAAPRPPAPQAPAAAGAGQRHCVHQPRRWGRGRTRHLGQRATPQPGRGCQHACLCPATACRMRIA